MEPNQDEELYFENLDTRHLDAAYNHTPSGAYASYLHGDTTMVGPAIYLPVSKGDTISIEVWARSLYVNGQTTTLPSLVTAVTGAFGGVDGGTESQQQIYDLLEGALGTVGLLGSSDSDEVPNATLNYLFFDENLNFINTLGSGFDFAAITSAAASGWERLSLTKVADKKGYLYIYVANESPGDKVWFDDLKIVQKEHPVVQTDDCYPFGATFNGYVSGLKNRYQYQSKEFQEDLDLGIYDFEWRQYDPWNVTTTTADPLAEKFYSYSPYSWALNNPLKFIDPDGREVKSSYRSLEDAANGTVTLAGMVGDDGNGNFMGSTKGNSSEVGDKNKKPTIHSDSEEPVIRNGVAGLKGEAQRRVNQNGGSNPNEGIAEQAELYVDLNTMPGNWKLLDNSDPAVTGGYSFGAKNPPGMCVDCSGLISGSFMGAGFPDPNMGDKVSGILNIESNLMRVGVPLSNPDPQRGDVVTFRNPAPLYPYHGGIVTHVQYVPYAAGNMLIKFVHSSSRQGGAVESSFNLKGNSFFARNLHGFYRRK